MKRNNTVRDRVRYAKEAVDPERNVDADLSPVARYDTKDDRRELIPLEPRRRFRIVVAKKPQPKRSVAHAIRVLRVERAKVRRNGITYAMNPDDFKPTKVQ